MLGRLLAVPVDILAPEAVVIVDRSLPEIPEVGTTYAETVRAHTVGRGAAGDLVVASSFLGQVLEVAGAAVALDELFRAPLEALTRWAAPPGATSRSQPVTVRHPAGATAVGAERRR